jgi:hypothetical protein
MTPYRMVVTDVSEVLRADKDISYWSAWTTMSFHRSYASWSCATLEFCVAGDSGLLDVTQSKTACIEEECTSTIRNIGDDERLHIDTTSDPGRHETCMVLVFQFNANTAC